MTNIPKYPVKRGPAVKQFIHQTQVDTNRYAFHVNGDGGIDVVCNVCPDADDLPQRVISSMKAPGLTPILAAVTRHEQTFHKAVRK